MYQYLVIANTHNGTVFQTGSKNCQPHSSKQMNYELAARYDTSQNKNYATWAKKLIGPKHFEYKFFYAETTQEVRQLALDWINQNGWDIHPSRSRPSMAD